MLVWNPYSRGENEGSERLSHFVQSKSLNLGMSDVAISELERKQHMFGWRKPALGDGQYLLPELGCELGGPSQGNPE